MSLPEINLTQGIHALHLFYRIQRVQWSLQSDVAKKNTLETLKQLCRDHNEASYPKLRVFTNIGGKADIAFFYLGKTLGELGVIQRTIETSFPPGTLEPVFQFLSLTELSEYMSSEDDQRKNLEEEEGLEPGSEAFEKRMAEIKKRIDEYRHYRLYPELPDWDIMGFYPMNKRRQGEDNWYRLDYPTRKRLMAGHARVGRKYHGRISQLITGSTGLDDWEWGVTLMAQQTDAIKEIVYEMRFDEVTARFGEFGPFFINLRLEPEALFEHLKLL